MPIIRVTNEREPFDITLRKFKRACEKAGIVRECRERQHYEKPTWVRKAKKAAAVGRQKKLDRMKSNIYTRLY